MSIQRRNRVVPVRFSHAERQAVRRAARVANKRLSAFVRESVLETLARIEAAALAVKEEQP